MRVVTRAALRPIPLRVPTGLAVAFWAAVTLGAAVSAAGEGWGTPQDASARMHPPAAASWTAWAAEPRFDAAGQRYRTRTDW